MACITIYRQKPVSSAPSMFKIVSEHHSLCDENP
jgi:hypothetical protein